MLVNGFFVLRQCDVLPIRFGFVFCCCFLRFPFTGEWKATTQAAAAFALALFTLVHITTARDVVRWISRRILLLLMRRFLSILPREEEEEEKTRNAGASMLLLHINIISVLHLKYRKHALNTQHRRRFENFRFRDHACLTTDLRALMLDKR